MVGIGVAAKGGTRVEHAVLCQVEVILCNELPQVSRAEMVFLRAKGIVQIKGINAQLVRHHHITVIGHAACHPVMAADGLQPPDLVYVLECNAIHFISTVGLQQLAQPLHALAGGVDVGQHQIDDVLLADAAGHLGLLPPGRLVHHQRVSAQHAGVGGDGLGGGHADIGGIDTGCGPDPLALHSVGHGGHPHGVTGQRDLHMGQHRAVDRRMLLGLDHHEFLCREMAGTGIVVAGDHGGAVIGCVFTNQKRCTCHNIFSSESKYLSLGLP